MLQSYLEKHPIGKLYNAPFDVYLDETNVFQPDLVFIAKQNYSILTDAGVEGAPDLVVEILSSKTAHLDKKPKRRVYARSGVKEFWLVDPAVKLVHVYYLQEDSEQPAAAFGERETLTSARFPSLKINVSRIFKR